MNRPWDYEQRFTSASDGEVTDTDGYYGHMANLQDERLADAVEREEVRDTVAGAKSRHMHPFAVTHLTDVPFIVAGPVGHVRPPERDEDTAHIH